MLTWSARCWQTCVGSLAGSLGPVPCAFLVDRCPHAARRPRVFCCAALRCVVRLPACRTLPVRGRRRDRRPDRPAHRRCRRRPQRGGTACDRKCRNQSQGKRQVPFDVLMRRARYPHCYDIQVKNGESPLGSRQVCLTVCATFARLWVCTSPLHAAHLQGGLQRWES